VPRLTVYAKDILESLGVVAWELPRATIRQMPAHSHAEAQLCGLDGGLAILETAAGAWTCPPGRCVWIPSGMVHSLRSCGKISGWMMRIATGVRATRERDGLPVEPRILALSPLLKEIVVRMMTWVDNPECVTANTVYVRINHGPCEVREPALLIEVTILPLLDMQHPWWKLRMNGSLHQLALLKETQLLRQHTL
jgi:hypothetical protein